VAGENLYSNRRKNLLVRLRRLFAEIDDAFARNDFDCARANNECIAELLAEIAPRPPRLDASRASGIQRRQTARVLPTSSRRVS
jgi:hypothetical protein